MWIVIASCLAAVCIILALALWAQSRNLRSGARQLRERIREGSGTRVDLEVPGAAAGDLLDAVNELTEAHRKERVAFREREQAMRRQIANVSHDLRTPLTSILGYLQLLESEDLSEEERREYRNIVRGRAETLGTLIGTFYDLSCIENGDYPLTVEQVELAPLLRRQIAESWSDFADRGITVEAELDEDLPPVWADRRAAVRMLTNLLGNAGKHAFGSLDVRMYREGDRVVTAFSNPAAGLSPEDVPHVFERSYTGDKPRSGRDTGLGLAIVKALAERMGHTVFARLDGEIFTVGICWRCSQSA